MPISIRIIPQGMLLIIIIFCINNTPLAAKSPDKSYLYFIIRSIFPVYIMTCKCMSVHRKNDTKRGENVTKTAGYSPQTAQACQLIFPYRMRPESALDFDVSSGSTLTELAKAAVLMYHLLRSEKHRCQR